MRDMNDDQDVTYGSDASVGDLDDRFDSFVRSLRDEGIEVTVASDADPENVERARKKYAHRALRERLGLSPSP